MNYDISIKIQNDIQYIWYPLTIQMILIAMLSSFSQILPNDSPISIYELHVQPKYIHII